MFSLFFPILAKLDEKLSVRTNLENNSMKINLQWKVAVGTGVNFTNALYNCPTRLYGI